MGIHKFKIEDRGQTYDNGSTPLFSKRGFLAGIDECPGPFGPRKVYVQGRAKDFPPAALHFRGTIIRGFVSFSQEGYHFHPYRGEHSVFPYVHA